MNRLEAPAGDGEAVVVPPLEEWAGLAERNHQALRGWPGREEARAEVLALAGERADGPWFVAGHQPELFHPGVWVKSFALAGQARRAGGVAVNLVIDTDTLKSAAVRVPVRERWPRAETVPFDRWRGEAPWEERGVIDEELFSTFGERIAERMRAWGVRPLAERFWPMALAMPGTIGERFAEARRRIGREWGCRNVEVPMSAVCGTRAFRSFAEAVARDAARFREVHNRAVAEYRARNGIRSDSHPVPDLAEGEVPFWAWRAGEVRRSRVFAPAGRLDSEGKLRSRALATTLFSRLFLADLFVHGIGGGKYDELADALIRGFFGIEPPGYAVLTATRLLPLPLFGTTRDDARRLASRLRELDYNPQRFLPPG
ncbi:MAG: hypothetical protein K2W96_00575, partial [Gemmataceae bacterium]|nr:hypothetical protein [Gemmataceae bacterium]